MSVTGICALVYGGGLFVGLVYAGAKGIPFMEDDYWSTDSVLPFERGWFALVWPLIAPIVIGRELAEWSERREKRRRLVEQEKRKWLEAPLP